MTWIFFVLKLLVCPLMIALSCSHLSNFRSNIHMCYCWTSLGRCFGAKNESNHQNFKKSLLSYKCGLIFNEMKQKKVRPLFIIIFKSKMVVFMTPKHSLLELHIRRNFSFLPLKSNWLLGAPYWKEKALQHQEKCSKNNS